MQRALKVGIGIAVSLALVVFGFRQRGNAAPTPPPGQVLVTFSGGHQTYEIDHGRPVVLIAAALGVPSEVFRDAFSRVHPAPTWRGPTGDEQRENKRALLDTLGKYGITNERLDEVSNHYRYRRERGELWPTRDAIAFATVKDGRLVKIDLKDGGSGYSSPPAVSIPCVTHPQVQLKLTYDRDFERNGAIETLTPSTP